MTTTFTSAPVAKATRGDRGDTDLHRANDVLAMVLVALVVLSPLPLGSNRPFFWALAATLVGLIGAAYLALVAVRGYELRMPLRRIGPLALAYGLVGLWLAVQILPLGALLPITFADGVGGTFLSRTLSLAPGDTFLMLLQTAGYGMLFLLVLQVAVNPRRARLALRVLFLAIAAYGAFGMISLTQLGDTVLGMPKWSYLGSATGTFVNRNSYATFLAFGAVIGIALLMQRAASAERMRLLVTRTNVVDLVALAVTGAALLATDSRMGVLAGTCGVAAVLLLGAIRYRVGFYGWLAAIAASVVASVVLYANYGVGMLERLLTVDFDAGVRLTLYDQVAGMIAERPLLGYGGGAFEQAFALFQRPPLSANFTWDKAHSTYLALWAELGIPIGSVPMVVIAGIGITCAVRFLRGSSAPEVLLAAAGVVVTGGVHSLVDFSLEVQAVAYVFVTVLALGTAAVLRTPSLRRDADLPADLAPPRPPRFTTRIRAPQ